MRYQGLLVLVGTLVLPALAGAGEPDDTLRCPTAKACLQALAKLESHYGISYGWAMATPLNDDARTLADRALLLGGKAILPELAKLVEARDGEVAAAVAVVVGSAGPDAKPIFPLLLRALTSTRNRHRYQVSHAFSASNVFSGPNSGLPYALMAIDAKRAFPHLVRASQMGFAPATLALLETPEGYAAVQRCLSGDRVEMVLRTLRFWHEATGQGLDLLLLALDNPSLERMSLSDLVEYLARIPATWKRLEPLIERWEHSEDQRAQYGAAELRLAIDPLLAMSALEKELSKPDNPDPKIGRYLETIARAGDLAVATIPRLRALQKGLAPVAAGATWALGWIPGPEAATAVVEGLQVPQNWRTVLMASRALERRPQDGAAAIPPLRVLAKTHWHPSVRASATAALKAIEGAPGAANGPARDTPGVPDWLSVELGNKPEPVGNEFLCALPTTWGKPIDDEERVPVPGMPGETTKKSSLHRLADGWLRLETAEEGIEKELPNVNPDTVRFRTAHLYFLPERPQTGAKPLAMPAGHARAMTGDQRRFFLVENKPADFNAFTRRAGIALLEQEAGRWNLRSTVELPPGLARTGRLPDGSLIAAFPDSRLAVRIAADGGLTTGDCRPDPAQVQRTRLAVVQALLDDPGFVAELSALSPPLPLPVVLTDESESTADPSLPVLTFKGQPVATAKGKEADGWLQRGSTLEIGGVSRKPDPEDEVVHSAQGFRFTERLARWSYGDSDVFTVGVTFPQLGFRRSFTLEEKQGRWTCQHTEAPAE